MAMTHIKIFLLLVTLVVAQQNYQERALYLGEWDNPCAKSGKSKDEVKIILDIPGRQTYEKVELSSTFCNPGVVVSSLAIRPSTELYLYTKDLGIYIKFKEEPRYVYHLGVLLMIIERTTVEEVQLYGRTDYNCTIIGDGEIQHWGVVFQEYEPATIKVRCVLPNGQETVNLETESE